MGTRIFLLALPPTFIASFALGYSLQPKPAADSSRIPPHAAFPPAPDVIAPAPSQAPESSTPARATDSVEKPASVDAVFEALSARLFGERAFRVAEVIARLDATQVRELLDQIESVGRFDQWHILPRAVARLAELDQTAAFAWFEANAGSFREGSTTIAVAFELLAEKDPFKAREQFERLPPGDRRNEFGRILVQEMATRKPDEALAWVESLPVGAARDKAALGYVNGLAASDPNGAINRALRWKEGATRTAALSQAFHNLARSGMGIALAAADRVTEPREQARVLSWLTASAWPKDLPALAEYYEQAVQKTPELAESFNGIYRLAEGFARRDLDGALAWAQTLPAESRDAALAEALDIWAWRKPLDALAWVEKNTAAGGERQQRFDAIFGTWMNADFAAAQAWAEKLPAGPERDRTTSRVISRLASRGDDTRAMQWLDRLPEQTRSQLAQDIASDLTWSNAPLAARWLEHIEPDAQAAPLFGRVASEWAANDFKGAGAWVSSLPAGPVRDRATAYYAVKVAQVDPSAAAEWAASTADEATRFSVIGGVLSEWHRRDPAAATRWLEGSTVLTPARKETLRRHFR